MAKLFYKNELIADVLTNHSMSIEDLMEFADLSKLPEDYDYEDLKMEIE